MIEQGLRLKLMPIFLNHLEETVVYKPTITATGNAVEIAMIFQNFEMIKAHKRVDRPITDEKIAAKIDECKTEFREVLQARSNRLLSYFAERLKGQLRDQGARHDLVDAVFVLGGQDDLLMVIRRVEALGKFLDTDDGKNLLAGVKRASNILIIEEKKDSKTYKGAPKIELMSPIEAHLWRTIQQTIVDARHQIEKEDFVSAMEALSTLRSAVDSFFSKEAGIMVNDKDPAVRENRLKLLSQIREATRAVADFSKIQD
jgi:glycyl-tRNA synthetase beta chain